MEMYFEFCQLFNNSFKLVSNLLTGTIYL